MVVWRGGGRVTSRPCGVAVVALLHCRLAWQWWPHRGCIMVVVVVVVVVVDPSSRHMGAVAVIVVTLVLMRL